ncbi:MAG: hypothetical protein M1834_000612 [Cirrosporium novae-zelandiae]|nr:MAG: hypothetical protein M1834_000612 [Cirrosporium novae-zelandiae]
MVLDVLVGNTLMDSMDRNLEPRSDGSRMICVGVGRIDFNLTLANKEYRDLSASSYGDSEPRCGVEGTGKKFGPRESELDRPIGIGIVSMSMTLGGQKNNTPLVRVVFDSMDLHDLEEEYEVLVIIDVAISRVIVQRRVLVSTGEKHGIRGVILKTEMVGMLAGAGFDLEPVVVIHSVSADVADLEIG